MPSGALLVVGTPHSAVAQSGETDSGAASIYRARPEPQLSGPLDRVSACLRVLGDRGIRKIVAMTHHPIPRYPLDPLLK
jgi:hypothetical protein